MSAVDSSGVGDRSLVEDAVKMLLASAPAGWTLLHAEFEPSAHPAVAHAYATNMASGPTPLAVPPEAVELIGEYQRRAAAGGAPWRRIVVECDSTGGLIVRTGTPPSGPAAQANSHPAPPPRGRIALWLWGLAAIASIAVLVVAVVGRDRGNGPTLRPMTVNDSMSETDAHTAADTTVRAWVRERNARHLANLEALTCPDREGTVTAEVDAVKNHEPVGKEMQVVATGAFGRHGQLWALNTHFASGVSVQFVLGVRNGELLVCRIAAAPVP